MASTDDESVLGEELEVLESIYIHELSVERDDMGRPTLISLDLHPATGDDLEKQYVCMTLNIIPGCKYPDEPPHIEIRNPRGIGEDEIQRVTESMQQLALERKGGPVLYELTELAKECLTEGNIPYGPCTICLEHFTEGEAFTKTDCYHYFHQYCLARYIRHVLAAREEEEQETVPSTGEKEEEEGEEGVVCPVCRLPISYDLASLEEASEPSSGSTIYTLTERDKATQQKMAEIYQRQKEKGGIIDLEAEKNKYLVPANLVISLEKSIEDQELNGVDSEDGRSCLPNSNDSREPVTAHKSRAGSGRQGYAHSDHHSRHYRSHPRDRHRGQRYWGERREGRGHGRHQGEESMEKSVERYGHARTSRDKRSVTSGRENKQFGTSAHRDRHVGTSVPRDGHLGNSSHRDKNRGISPQEDGREKLKKDEGGRSQAEGKTRNKSETDCKNSEKGECCERAPEGEKGRNLVGEREDGRNPEKARIEKSASVSWNRDKQSRNFSKNGRNREFMETDGHRRDKGSDYSPRESKARSSKLEEGEETVQDREGVDRNCDDWKAEEVGPRGSNSYQTADEIDWRLKECSFGNNAETNCDQDAKKRSSQEGSRGYGRQQKSYGRSRGRRGEGWKDQSSWKSKTTNFKRDKEDQGRQDVKSKHFVEDISNELTPVLSNKQSDPQSKEHSKADGVYKPRFGNGNRNRGSRGFRGRGQQRCGDSNHCEDYRKHSGKPGNSLGYNGGTRGGTGWEHRHDTTSISSATTDTHPQSASK